MFLPSALLLYALVACSRSVSADVIDERFQYFKTEPDIRAARIDITHITRDRSLLAPGYFFFAPFGAGSSGPHIFDNDGEIIWYGREQTRGRTAKNFEVCDHLGEKGNHLCWSEVHYTLTNYELASNRVFDNTYTQVGRDYEAVGEMRSPNPHEFNMLPGGETFLQAIYQLKPMDLTPFNGPSAGWIEDGCFQEIEVLSGQPIFKFCLLEHIPITETYLYLHIPQNKANYSEGIGGVGTIQSAWDVTHLNAVDKNEEGDYLVSARHLDQILKIAGPHNVHGVKPGTVLWQLGGRSNNFEMEEEFEFHRQHHVRFLSSTATGDTISLFNNGWNIRNQDGFRNHSSSGQVITVNNSTMKARLDHEYIHPLSDQGYEESLSLALGSMNVLPNENAVVGWGTLPEISEYAPDGELLFHAGFTNHSGLNYRVFKQEWVGNPQSTPKLLAYSYTCFATAASPLVAYVSWNGATEVRSWRFYISTVSRNGPWLPAGTFNRTGFETTADLSTGFASFAPYVAAEALDASGKCLASVLADTFVPGPDFKQRCDARGCFEPLFFKYDPSRSCGDTCSRSHAPAFIVFLLVLAGIESMSWFAALYWRWTWRFNEGALGDGGLQPRKVRRGYRDSSATSSPLLGEKRPLAKRLQSGMEPSWKTKQPAVAIRVTAHV